MTWQGTVSWFGLQTGSLDLPVTAGAGITLLAVLFGWAFYAVFRSTRTARSTRATRSGQVGRDGSVQVFTGGDPLPSGDHLGAVDFAELAETTFAPVNRLLNPDPMYLAVWRAVRSSSQWVTFQAAALERHVLLACLILVALMAAAVWIW
jgi:hypothetical protein